MRFTIASSRNGARDRSSLPLAVVGHSARTCSVLRIGIEKPLTVPAGISNCDSQAAAKSAGSVRVRLHV
jgi:hypothetical protein